MWNLWTHLIYKLLLSQIMPNCKTRRDRSREPKKCAGEQASGWTWKDKAAGAAVGTKSLTTFFLKHEEFHAVDATLFLLCPATSFAFFCLTWDCEFQGYINQPALPGSHAKRWKYCSFDLGCHRPTRLGQITGYTTGARTRAKKWDVLSRASLASGCQS